MGGYTQLSENEVNTIVVICLQISNFEWVDTPEIVTSSILPALWFAYKLVTLNGWIHLVAKMNFRNPRCDLLTN